MVLLDGAVPSGTQESVDVKVIVGAGWGTVFDVVLQLHPATAVAVGLGDAVAVMTGLGDAFAAGLGDAVVAGLGDAAAAGLGDTVAVAAGLGDADAAGLGELPASMSRPLLYYPS